MTQKIAVAVVHGIGTQAPEFADQLEEAIQHICHETCGEDVVIKPVYWAPAMQKKEDDLWDRMTSGGPLNFKKIRRVAIDYVADALAYQPTPYDRKAYDDIHVIYAKTLRALAEEAGEKAPLCIVSHSLGTVITSNFIYDLQNDTDEHPLISPLVRAEMTGAPLEWGETLNLLYTLGSPLALWSLRFRDFGKPIEIPPPQLMDYYPDLQCAW
nr:chemotaxis protein [Anaerolineae bacterium]